MTTVPSTGYASSGSTTTERTGRSLRFKFYPTGSDDQRSFQFTFIISIQPPWGNKVFLTYSIHTREEKESTRMTETTTMTEPMSIAPTLSAKDQLQADLADLKRLGGELHQFLQTMPVALGKKIQEDYNEAATDTFHLIREDYNTSGGVVCACHDDGDTRGLEGRSLDEFLVNVDFDKLEAAQEAAKLAETTTATTAGLEEQQVSEQYKENQLEYQRQEALLKQFNESLRIAGAQMMSTDPL